MSVEDRLKSVEYRQDLVLRILVHLVENTDAYNSLYMDVHNSLVSEAKEAIWGSRQLLAEVRKKT